MRYVMNDKSIVFWHRNYARRVWKKSSEEFLYKVKKIMSICLKKIEMDIPDREVLFLNDQTRPDHLKLLSTIYDTCKRDKGYINYKYKFGIDFKSIIDLIGSVKYSKELKEVYDVDKNVVIGKKERIYILLNLIWYNKYERFLERNRLGDNTKLVVVLCDVLPEAEILVNYANSSKIMTATCQHGIINQTKEDRTVNYLNSWRIPSKIALLWGDYSAKYYKQLNEDLNCVLVGNPILFSEKCDKDNSKIAIVSDIPANKEYNQKIIEITEKYALSNNKKVLLRLHPTDKEENYTIDKKVTAFEKDIDGVEFIVGHTTTMIFNYLVKGYKVYVYNSEIQTQDIDESIKFKNYSEFCECINRNINFLNEGKKKICYIDEEAKIEYEKFFELFDKTN